MKSKSISVQRYQPLRESEWDSFVEASGSGTFLHTRRYLSYHGERFQDASLLLTDEHDRLVGIFPAALDPVRTDRIVSHPGITYGGIVHCGKLKGKRMLDAVAAIRGHYQDSGFRFLIYKAVPSIYHRFPSHDDAYALFLSGAARYRCDLSSAIDLLGDRCQVSTRRLRCLQKAARSGVIVAEGPQHVQSLWTILEENLARKHNAKPVHRLAEMEALHALFPRNIRFVVGMLGCEVVGGVVLYETCQVSHAQYIASSTLGNEMCVLDAVFNSCIRQASENGRRYFDFGISTTSEGRVLNSGLYDFKSEFGAGGVAYDFYELDLHV